MQPSQTKFYTECPSCTEVREKIEAVKEVQCRMIREHRDYPIVNGMEVKCPRCKDRGVVLTPDGEKLLRLFEEIFKQTYIDLDERICVLDERLSQLGDTATPM